MIPDVTRLFQEMKHNIKKSLRAWICFIWKISCADMKRFSGFPCVEKEEIQKVD